MESIILSQRLKDGCNFRKGINQTLDNDYKKAKQKRGSTLTKRDPVLTDMKYRSARDYSFF